MLRRMSKERPSPSSFVVANAALAVEAKATVIRQANGAVLATKGCDEHVFAPGFDPLKQLVDRFLEMGGTILVCHPCLESRKISPDPIVAGHETAKAGRVVQELLEVASVVTY